MNIHLYFKVLRPTHWLKNVFTCLGSWAALVFAHLSLNLHRGLEMVLALVLSCAVSSVNYIVNEVIDSPHDALHPKKAKRPIPSGRVKVWKLFVTAGFLLVASFMISLFTFSIHFSLWLGVLFLAGLIYNVRPIRTKDIPYLDVISESLNNPIRLMIGWYTFQEIHDFPPGPLIAAFWIFGAYVMTAKRLAELRELGVQAIPYRPVFAHYTQRGLTIAYTLYGILTCLLFLWIAWDHHLKLLFAFPFFLIFVLWFTKLTFEKHSIVTGPEYLYRRPIFFAYCIFFLLLTLGLSLP